MSDAPLPKMGSKASRKAGAAVDQRPHRAQKRQTHGAPMLAQDAPTPQYAPTDAYPAGGAMPLLAAADLQDHLMVASNDMDRLQGLLGDACNSLMEHFYGATVELKALLHRAAEHPDIEAPELHRAMQHMAGAITAMQFQDMASQLVDHTTRRLRNCADRIARDTMGDDEDGMAMVAEAPLRPNPVTQDEMDAGSVELF
jgi:hypothetical protein